MNTHTEIESPIYFSHLPSQGISVGAMKGKGDEILFAGCFTNNGTSFIGKFHRHKRDSFSRRRSREILTGRLLKTAAGYDVDLVVRLGTRATLRDFMWVLREHIKPKGQPEQWFRRGTSLVSSWGSLADLAKALLGEAEKLPTRLVAKREAAPGS